MRFKKINVCGIDYKIEYPKIVDGNPKWLGMCFLDEKRIEIKNSLDGEKELETWCHELVHSFHNEICLNQVVNDKVEEMLTGQTAKFLVSLFKQIKKAHLKK